MPAGLLDTDTMFSAREKPWHGLGQVVEEALTAEEALVAAGLDWEVTKQPIFQMLEGEDNHFRAIPKKVAIVRNTDEKVLGVTSNRYEPVQPVEGFTFVDSLVDSGDAKYETAGSLWDGQKIWMLAVLPKDVKVAGEDIDPYILFTNSFNGMESITTAVTPIRVVCQNTLNWALSAAQRTYRVRHRGDMEGKLQEAREVLGITFQYYEEFVNVGESLASESFSERMMNGILEELYPVEEGMSDRKVTNQEAAREAIMSVWKESPNLENIRDTKWGAVNAFAEFSDWGRKVKKERFGRIIRDTKLKQDSLDLVSTAT